MSHHHPQHAEHLPNAAEHSQHAQADAAQVDAAISDAASIPVAAPETSAAIEAARPAPQKPEGLMPQEPKLPLPQPPQTNVAPLAAMLQEAEHKATDLRMDAEQALAAYVREKLPKDLQKDLKLDVLPVVGYGKSGIKLCFHGPNVTTNAPMVNEVLISKNDGALTQHPVLKKFFHNVAELPKIEVQGDDMYHVIIPMSVEMYKATLSELAMEQPKAKAAAPAREEALAEAPVQAAEIPQAVVQAPVAALDKAVADDNALEHHGVAL